MFEEAARRGAEQERRRLADADVSLRLVVARALAAERGVPLGFFDEARRMEFDWRAMWTLRATGCSCPTPFGDLTWDGMRSIREVDDLRPLVERANEYGDGPMWDGTDPGVADLKAKVHRALRDQGRTDA